MIVVVNILTSTNSYTAEIAICQFILSSPLVA